MKILKYPKGAKTGPATCIIPISQEEKSKIFLACIKIDLPFLYQPYIKEHPIIGESIIGSKERTTNYYGTFFLEDSQFEILEDILDFEYDYFEELYEDFSIFHENKELYENHLERTKQSKED